jgi:hypothetical protein
MWKSTPRSCRKVLTSMYWRKIFLNTRVPQSRLWNKCLQNVQQKAKTLNQERVRIFPTQYQHRKNDADAEGGKNKNRKFWIDITFHMCCSWHGEGTFVGRWDSHPKSNGVSPLWWWRLCKGQEDDFWAIWDHFNNFLSVPLYRLCVHLTFLTVNYSRI